MVQLLIPSLTLHLLSFQVDDADDLTRNELELGEREAGVEGRVDAVGGRLCRDGDLGGTARDSRLWVARHELELVRRLRVAEHEVEQHLTGDEQTAQAFCKALDGLTRTSREDGALFI